MYIHTVLNVPACHVERWQFYYVCQVWIPSQSVKFQYYYFDQCSHQCYTLLLPWQCRQLIFFISFFQFCFACRDGFNNNRVTELYHRYYIISMAIYWGCQFNEARVSLVMMAGITRTSTHHLSRVDSFFLYTLAVDLRMVIHSSVLS